MYPSKFVLDKKILDKIEEDSLKAEKERKETLYFFFGNLSENQITVKEAKHVGYLRKTLLGWGLENKKQRIKEIKKYRKKSELKFLGLFHSHPTCSCKDKPSLACFSEKDIEGINETTKNMKKSKNNPYFVSALYCNKYRKTVFYSNFEIIEYNCEMKNENMPEFIKNIKELEVLLKD